MLFVPRAFGLTLALLLGTLAIADRFICPDGCTENEPAKFDCVICHGFAPDAAPPLVAAIDVVARACPSAPIIPAQPLPRSIDHPPRA